MFNLITFAESILPKSDVTIAKTTKEWQNRDYTLGLRRHSKINLVTRIKCDI